MRVCWYAGMLDDVGYAGMRVCWYAGMLEVVGYAGMRVCWYAIGVGGRGFVSPPHDRPKQDSKANTISHTPNYKGNCGGGSRTIVVPKTQPNDSRAAVWLSFWCSTRPSADTGTD